MATIRAHAVPVQLSLNANRRDWLGIVLSMLLPLCLFVIADGVARLNGFVPLYFAPFGLPGWMAVSAHLSILPLLGTARWMVVSHGAAGRSAGRWLVGLIVAVVGLPFIVVPLDPLMLTLVAMVLSLAGFATALRVASVSPQAALVMLPGVLWLGLSAFVGLSLLASWSPPFGLANAQPQGLPSH